MPFSLVPKRLCRSIYALDLDALHARGIRVLFADLDNTLARYSEHAPSEELRAWVQNVETHGIRLFVLSNSRKATRADVFAAHLRGSALSWVTRSSPIFWAATVRGYTASLCTR